MEKIGSVKCIGVSGHRNGKYLTLNYALCEQCCQLLYLNTDFKIRNFLEFLLITIAKCEKYPVGGVKGEKTLPQGYKVHEV